MDSLRLTLQKSLTGCLLISSLSTRPKLNSSSWPSQQLYNFNSPVLDLSPQTIIHPSMLHVIWVSSSTIISLSLTKFLLSPNLASNHIRCLRRIRPSSIIPLLKLLPLSLVHSKLDYCNSLYFRLPQTQLSRLQRIQNSLARTVVSAPRSSHITPILKSLHWLKINQRIDFKYFLLHTNLSSSLAHPTFVSSYSRSHHGLHTLLLTLLFFILLPLLSILLSFLPPCRTSSLESAPT